MNIFKLAEALGVDTTCTKVEIDFIRKNYDVGMDTAREILIEPRIYKQIKLLVRIITDKNEYD